MSEQNLSWLKGRSIDQYGSALRLPGPSFHFGKNSSCLKDRGEAKGIDINSLGNQTPQLFVLGGAGRMELSVQL